MALLLLSSSCQFTKPPLNKEAPSVLSMAVIPRTPERLARGKYLVEGLVQCFLCHSEIDYAHRGTQPLHGKKGGGFVFPADESEVPLPYRVVAPNISPDPDYGAGKWKDSDFVRALRQGIGHDGRTLFPLMPFNYFRHLSDADLASIIVYERSIAPVHIQRPKTELPQDVMQTLQPLPPLERVPEPDKSSPGKYGEYLVTVGHCDLCHTPVDEKGNALAGMSFAGGAPMVGPWGTTVASLNLTPDPSGISYFDERMFIDTIRNGSVKARLLSNAMPWGYFRNLTDEDLKAIFAYLRTLKPVRHRVDNTEPPTYCKLCRSKHGMGDRN
ncbi:MAG TPA: cytochrome c [Terriglobales bacterium]|nr:cytochrome c [Terriglobales bacterium]